MHTIACGSSPTSVRPASNVVTHALICNSRSDAVTLAMERTLLLELIMDEGVLPKRGDYSPDSDANVRERMSQSEGLRVRRRRARAYGAP